MAHLRTACPVPLQGKIVTLFVCNLWNIFIQRWQSFLFGRGNRSIFSISKIRYYRYPCEHIWYVKFMIFLLFVSSEYLYTKLSSAFSFGWMLFSSWLFDDDLYNICSLIPLSYRFSKCIFPHRISLGFTRKRDSIFESIQENVFHYFKTSETRNYA